jgi:hypothetical protein
VKMLIFITGSSATGLRVIVKALAKAKVRNVILSIAFSPARR